MDLNGAGILNGLHFNTMLHQLFCYLASFCQNHNCNTQKKVYAHSRQNNFFPHKPVFFFLNQSDGKGTGTGKGRWIMSILCESVSVQVSWQPHFLWCNSIEKFTNINCEKAETWSDFSLPFYGLFMSSLSLDWIEEPNSFPHCLGEGEN